MAERKPQTTKKRAGKAKAALIAPDKFRATLTASAAAEAIAAGLKAGGVNEIRLQPVSDGGEGTLDLLLTSSGGQAAHAVVSDPLGRPIGAEFGILGDNTACIEMAKASGLDRVKPGERDAWRASTTGTGELILAAIESGARSVLVTVGGSATTDGGRGALEVLGARFRRMGVDLGQLRSNLGGVRLTVACDVQNPFLGPEGAAAAFAPQKGADATTVARLERRLKRIARLAQRATGRDPSNVPMAGAAGGLAGGLWAFAGAELRPGAAVVLDTVDFDSQLKTARAVVTGEGNLDRQTLNGKAVAEVAIRARQAGVACHAIVGCNLLSDFDLRLISLESVLEAPAHSTAGAKRAVTRAAKSLAADL